MVLCICGHHWKNHHKQKWRDFNVPCGVTNMPDMPIFEYQWFCNCWTFEYPDPDNEGEVLETAYYYDKKNGRVKLRRN